jgi:thiol:disulfide interchange protein
MKKIFVLFLLFIANLAQAQIKEPTKWSYKINPASYKVGDVVDVEFIATIDKGYYIYSNDFDPNLGPTLTTFEFQNPKGYELVGKAMAIKSIKKFDEVWEGTVAIFKGTGKFVQKIKIIDPAANITVKIDYQTCNEGSCVPGKKTLEIDLKVGGAPSKTNEEEGSKEVDAIKKATTDSSKAVAITPIVTTEKVKADSVKSTETTTTLPLNTEKPKDDSLWNFLVIAFLAGLASIFMPCIFPIMPMTVSYFIKQENGKFKAIFYGVSIMLIFASMGLVTKQLGAPFLNFLSTHWVPNLIFFIVFIVFGISLLGAFEITLPHSTVNKVDRLGDKGGLIGIFFMALALVLVSFSCTVPFVGSILIAAAQGEVMRPIYGMLAFGLPFALVFGGLAMFPSALKSLPKSGGWLNELKAVAGFMELAFAFKFLSNIDLTRHWNLLHRNIFLMIWIVAGVIIVLYILGFMRFSKDSKVEKIAPLRAGFAALFFVFTVYMIPGLANKSLPILSGILPPLIGGSSSNAPDPRMKELVLGLYGFHQIEEAQEYAKKVNKPILIDFTGYACANCRKMEENVWPKAGIKEVMNDKYVIASLYVDDKEILPKDKQYISSYDKSEITTVGAKNMDFEITKYNNNAQPYYVVIDANGKLLAGPISYSKEEDFKIFLEKGLK